MMSVLTSSHAMIYGLSSKISNCLLKAAALISSFPTLFCSLVRRSKTS